jgi:hypothetical protein
LIWSVLNVDKSAGEQGSKETEISGQTIHALPALWKVEGGLPQIQNLPDLF